MAKNKSNIPEAESLLKSKFHIDYDDLTSQQKEAADMVDDWLHTKKKAKNMIMRIGAVSGFGKSFLIRYLIENYKFSTKDCLVVAYTGQAVNVLRQSGIMAKTIHSTFMRAKEEPIRDKQGNIIYRRGVPLTKVKFIPVKSLPSTIKLVICDEASFLSESIEKLIVSYNVPLLEIGDPVQLPPVAGKQCFYMDNLDFFGTKIMRQAKDSEIIQLASSIRNYEKIDPLQFKSDVRFLIAQKTTEDTFFKFQLFFKHSDMVLTTNNRDRTDITKLYREYIIKTKSPYPVRGEKLICRKNDWNLLLGDFPLTNGTQGYAVNTVAKSYVDTKRDLYTMDFRPIFVKDDYYDGLVCDSEFLAKDFGSRLDSYKSQFNIGKKFEYAHAITTHSSQGSQAETVLFIDNHMRDKEYHMRLRYTAVTRASKKLYYLIPYSMTPGWSDLFIN